MREWQLNHFESKAFKRKQISGFKAERQQGFKEMQAPIPRAESRA
jgi:hypothetical protein